MFLTKDAILQRSDLPYEDVDVPEWGGTVRIRTLTGLEVDSFLVKTSERPDRKAETVKDVIELLLMCLVDENNNRLFNEKEFEALGKKNWNTLQRLFKIAMDLNALSQKKEDEQIKN